MSLGLPGWTAAWQELGAAAADARSYRRLIACWSEPHRHYHTLQHLGECLALFEEVRHLAVRPAEVALAIWFHDAFYDPRRTDNEERSAQWARECMLRCGVDPASAQRVHALVMATQHEDAPDDEDAQLTVDIDLSILGGPPARFEESDRQIRAEYAHVPDEEYRLGRQRVLSGFLERSRLYSTDHFHSLLEARARDNLQRALARLALEPGASAI